MADDFVIWSYEHRAWWRADHLGYTRNLAEAGRYSQLEAEQIVTEANYAPHITHEVAVLADDADEWFDEEYPDGLPQ